MELNDIHIGDRLWWHDPDNPDEAPDPVMVVRKNGETVVCQFTAGVGYGCVEAYAHELEMKANGNETATHRSHKADAGLYGSRRSLVRE